MDGLLIAKVITFAIFVAIAIRGGLAGARKRKPDADGSVVIRPKTGRYEIRLFPPYGQLYTFEEFQELLKIYSCSDDNGTSHWAGADGEWFDRSSNEYVRACPHEIRKGRRPEVFFTHIMYYPK